MKRYVTFDFIRGAALLGVVVAHRIVWDYIVPVQGITLDSRVSLLEGLLFLFISMAGVFYVISGAMNAYVTWNRIYSRENRPTQIILGGWVTGLVLILFSYLFKIFLLRATDEQTGILTYFILTGSFQGIDPVTISHMGTLQMIAITIIFISSFLGILLKYEFFWEGNLIYFILCIVGVIVLAFTPFLQSILGPTVINAIEAKNWGYVLVMSPIIHLYFPFFPYISYGCFGAIFGIAFAREENPKWIKISMAILILIFFLYALFNFKGYEIQASYAELDTLLNQLARQIMQLGLFFLLILVGLSVFDLRSEEKQRKWEKRTNWINEVGRHTLTMFMFEGFLSVILIRLINPIWPTYNSSLLNIALFGLINAICWLIIMILWKKFDYKGSAEWCIAYIVKKLSGKKSSRLKVKEEEKEIDKG